MGSVPCRQAASTGVSSLHSVPCWQAAATACRAASAMPIETRSEPPSVSRTPLVSTVRTCAIVPWYLKTCRYGVDFGTKAQMLEFVAAHLPPGWFSRPPALAESRVNRKCASTCACNCAALAAALTAATAICADLPLPSDGGLVYCDRGVPPSFRRRTCWRAAGHAGGSGGRWHQAGVPAV